ncbi:hypothetical protein [endosymbiont GvMRE of Glomus versiforme]|uniref:hypothetical protein n=1 Tax=endosymbiont GvMRE of Glomus versiforme TaxID=2039283 RepID=UPI0011C3CC44|nr:hypothetical protein [endosymbiont GvMRE of Glomus versiforme]
MNGESWKDLPTKRRQKREKTRRKEWFFCNILEMSRLGTKRQRRGKESTRGASIGGLGKEEEKIFA